MSGIQLHEVRRPQKLSKTQEQSQQLKAHEEVSGLQELTKMHDPEELKDATSTEASQVLRKQQKRKELKEVIDQQG